MSDLFQWRRRFADLVEDVFRDLGFPPPAMTHDPASPLAMEIEVDGVSFEVVHTPDKRPECLLIECKFGHPPPDRAVEVYQRLMEVNLVMARMHQAAFGTDPRSSAVIFTSSQTLESCSTASLMEEMRALAVRAKEWQGGFYLEQESSGLQEVLA